MQRFLLSKIQSLLVLCGILTVLFAVSGCGFKLRGQSNVDLTGVAVSIEAEDDFHPLVIGLKRKLQRLGASLASDKTSSNVIVLISNPVEKQKTLSVDDNGRPLEYELQIELSALVTTSTQLTTSQDDLPDPSTIFARRVLVYDNSQLLAKARERDQVRQQIHTVLIDQLLERIRGAHAIKY